MKSLQMIFIEISFTQDIQHNLSFNKMNLLYLEYNNNTTYKKSINNY